MGSLVWSLSIYEGYPWKKRGLEPVQRDIRDVHKGKIWQSEQMAW